MVDRATALLAQQVPLPCGVVLANRIVRTAATSPSCPLTATAGLTVSADLTVDHRPTVAAPDHTASPVWVRLVHPAPLTTAVPASRPLGTPSTVDRADLLTRFADTAARSVAAGYHGVQVHAGRGLLTPFPHSTRGDDHGSRRTLLLDVLHAVRRQVGDDTPVAVTLRPRWRTPDRLADYADLARVLADEGVDLLELTGVAGGRTATTDLLRLADLVRASTPVPMLLTGVPADPTAMALAVAGGAIDLVAPADRATSPAQ